MFTRKMKSISEKLLSSREKKLEITIMRKVLRRKIAKFPYRYGKLSWEDGFICNRIEQMIYTVKKVKRQWFDFKKDANQLKQRYTENNNKSIEEPMDFMYAMFEVLFPDKTHTTVRRRTRK
uniref:Uncharacterized protein n=1 Tax=Octopus bimaculoides TaxID=37653 RepID=A0A0L8HAQ8_OCTBM